MSSESPAQRWIPAGAALGAVVAGSLAYTTTLGTMAALAMLGFVWLLVFPRLGIPLLVVVSALSRFAVPWSDSQIRIEILLVLLLSAVLLNRLIVRTLPIASLRSPMVWPLIAYLAVNVVSTLLLATERTRGLKLDAEILAACLSYMLVVTLVRSRGDLDRALSALWIMTVVEATIGLLLLAAFVAHTSTVGVQLGDFGLPMAYGTAWEANIFGSFLLGNFFILLADFLRGRRSLLRALGLALIVAGMAASLTRTVWFGLLLGLILFVALTGRVRGAGSILLPLISGISIAGIAAIVIGSSTPFASRILDTFNLQSSSASGRFTIFNAALSDWKESPVLGLGTGSFNFGAALGQAHPWLPNLPLLTLHDTGLVGLAALLLLVFCFFRYTFGALQGEGEMATLAAGSMAGFAALLVAFQTTSGFWFVYPWVVVGLGIAAARLAQAGA